MYSGSWINIKESNEPILIVLGGIVPFTLLLPVDGLTGFDAGKGATAGANSLALSILVDRLQDSARAERIAPAFAVDVIGKMTQTEWRIERFELDHDIERLESTRALADDKSSGQG